MLWSVIAGVVVEYKKKIDAKVGGWISGFNCTLFVHGRCAPLADNACSTVFWAAIAYSEGGSHVLTGTSSDMHPASDQKPAKGSDTR